MKHKPYLGASDAPSIKWKRVSTDLAWQEVAKPVEVLVGCKLIAFDPNFIFRMKDGSQVNVPFTFIMELSHQLSDSMIIDNVYYKNLKKKEEV